MTKTEAIAGTVLSAVCAAVLTAVFLEGHIMTGSFLMGLVIFGAGLVFCLIYLFSGGYRDDAYLQKMSRAALAGFGSASLTAGGIGAYLAAFRSVSGAHRAVLAVAALLFITGGALIFRRALARR